MKILFLITIIITAICVAIYFFKPDIFKSIKNDINKNISTISTFDSDSKKTTIYKWTDANGVLQISNTPPMGKKYLVEELQHSKNVMPAQALTGKKSK